MRRLLALVLAASVLAPAAPAAASHWQSCAPGYTANGGYYVSRLGVRNMGCSRARALVGHLISTGRFPAGWTQFTPASRRYVNGMYRASKRLRWDGSYVGD